MGDLWVCCDDTVIRHASEPDQGYLFFYEVSTGCDNGQQLCLNVPAPPSIAAVESKMSGHQENIWIRTGSEISQDLSKSKQTASQNAQQKSKQAESQVTQLISTDKMLKSVQ